MAGTDLQNQPIMQISDQSSWSRQNSDSQQTDTIPVEIQNWSKRFTRKYQSLLRVEEHRDLRRSKGIQTSFLPVIKIGVSTPEQQPSIGRKPVSRSKTIRAGPDKNLCFNCGQVLPKKTGSRQNSKEQQTRPLIVQTEATPVCDEAVLSPPKILRP